MILQSSVLDPKIDRLVLVRGDYDLHTCPVSGTNMDMKMISPTYKVKSKRSGRE
jgi:hypothetical protein